MPGRVFSATQICCIVVSLLALSSAGASLAASAASELRFLRNGKEVARLDLSELRRECVSQRIDVDDPYYGRAKSFFAFSAACVLERGFGASPGEGDNLFLRAADGYVRPTLAAPLWGDDAWLAFADAERTAGPDARPVWEPIDRRQVDPGPFYMIWNGIDQNDPHQFPWPYQLVAVDIAPFESEYPHTIPAAAPSSPAARGFALFRSQCVACHAINGEGGSVGPDLNVPQSIVEYRPVEQIRAYIRDPQTFRYTSMPSHRHLGDTELDALIAYFRAMSQRKHHPRREP